MVFPRTVSPAPSAKSTLPLNVTLPRLAVNTFEPSCAVTFSDCVPTTLPLNVTLPSSTELVWMVGAVLKICTEPLNVTDPATGLPVIAGVMVVSMPPLTQTPTPPSR